jgi:hypothetical protein
MIIDCSQSDNGEHLVFLLGHALLIVEQKNKADLFKVHQRVREGPAYCSATMLTIYC